MKNYYFFFFLEICQTAFKAKFRKGNCLVYLSQVVDGPFEFICIYCLVNNILLEMKFLYQSLGDLCLRAYEIEPWKLQAFSVNM